MRPRFALTAVIALASAALMGAPAHGAAQWTLDTRYDPAIPTPEQVLGHAAGEVVTPPEGIATYFQALAEAAPDRTHLWQYGETFEGRPLYMLAIGSRERMASRAEVQEGMARLAFPRGLSAADQARLIAELPVITALAHSIHGNEISPAGSSMVTAYHLLAAQGDPDVELILRESIVLIDPLQNPDGRARFVAGNLVGRAADPDPDPLSAERDEPWPGGRANHYLFDLNRDWFAHTQPESRGRTAALLEWNPQVVVDLHEMGGNLSYYFPPSAVPGNPFTTDDQKALFDLFGRNNAAVFDGQGWPYFIREIFDSFYPGYGASWPTAQGALGKTFEQGSARGLVFERYDGTHLTYAQGVEQNFRAALRTALTAAENRERMLRSFLEFRRSAGMDESERSYVLLPGDDPARALRLARTLVWNGIEVREATAPFRMGGREFPAGAYVVPVRQPAGRLVRNLLDRDVFMDEAFVQIQRERRARRLPDQIYDVTAWNMAFLWDVESVSVPGGTPAASRPVERVATGPLYAGFEGVMRGSLRDAPPPAPTAALPVAVVGWLLPWNTAGAEVAARALQEGIRLHAAGAPFTLEGRRFGTGTLLARTGELSGEERTRLATLAAQAGAQVIPVNSGFVDEGISLGSGQMRALRAPRVLLLWDTPTSSLSAGWARWVLEQRYGQHTTAVRVGSFGRTDLSRYDVIVLPSGNYGAALSGGNLDRLRRWVQDGGTLITLAEATRWATAEGVDLLATWAEDRIREERPSTGPPIDLLEAVTPEREPPEPVSGAILRARFDPEHPLAAGSGGEMGVMVAGSRVFTPLTLDRGTNVGVYAPLDELVMSGIVWEEAQPQLANKAFLMRQSLGRGKVIAFAEDPNYRGYAEGTQLLFMNAVILGPAF
jgi:hypothetical protein